MQLWDKASGNLTDFTTHFTFSIDSKGRDRPTYGDGLAFFLGPEQFPFHSFQGAGLGLVSDKQPPNTTVNQLVAVEFDIYSNYDFDPPGEHVGSLYAIHTLRSWNFSSSLEIDGNATNPRDPPAASPPNNGTRRNRKKEQDGHEEDEEGGHVLEEYMDDEFERGTGPKKFSYRELARATKNFKDEEKLGEGGFGGVYRGFLKEIDSFVAVKRVSRGSKQGIKEYAAEVKIISRLRHRNLVQLIGWCHERKELLLVYEFMPHGSLDSHLFKETSLLPWEVRPIDPEASNEDQVSMVRWVWELYGEGKLIEAVDPRLCGQFNKTQMERLMIVGLSCAHPDEHLRPSIRQSLHILQEG
ncbi:RECEPTOR LECTIN KINASE [Salix koriyanagi]|uniref:RECEPTOR LECTIN KINASE n=1 Tax=Salix koriyanagi TaxID=2511006 RepID=A0A9Q0X285_9ROSI|nr:RECEPTOR LECTIN KINASE [Salix koriyanagi]